jgi:hypothetical protein
VKLLIAKKAALLEHRDKFGRTALSFAAANGHESVVNLLLAKNYVDIILKNVFGLSPLSLAVKRGHYNIWKLLLQGANERGIPVQKDISLDISSEPYPLKTTCIFCMLNIRDREIYHRCSSCNFDGGGFDICQACVARNLHCRDASHQIIIVTAKIEA